MSDEKIKNGRPFKISDPEEMAQRIDTYFANCDPHIEMGKIITGYTEKGEPILENRKKYTRQVPYTVTGIAIALGVSRRTLLNYQNPEHWSDDIEPEIRQQLFLTISEAIDKVEEFNERQLHKSGVANGVKFNLTNNFDWKDTKEVNTRNVDEVLDELDGKKSRDQSREELAEEAESELENEPGPEAQE